MQFFGIVADTVDPLGGSLPIQRREAVYVLLSIIIQGVFQ